MYAELHPESPIPDLFSKIFYSVKILADMASGDLEKFSGTLLDVCGPSDHYVFEGPRKLPKRKRGGAADPNDDEEEEIVIETKCPTCTVPRSTERQLLIMDIVGKVQTMWKHGPTHELFM